MSCNANVEVQANQVEVNGEIIPIAENPTYRLGKPKREARVSRVGDERVTTISEDYSEAYSSVTLKLRRTKDILEKIEDWQDNICGNGIILADTTTGFVKTFNHMTVTEDPEIDLTSDTIEVTFVGDEAV